LPDSGRSALTARVRDGHEEEEMPFVASNGLTEAGTAKTIAAGGINPDSFLRSIGSRIVVFNLSLTKSHAKPLFRSSTLLFYETSFLRNMLSNILIMFVVLEM
jgi:hypothetical protein